MKLFTVGGWVGSHLLSEKRCVCFPESTLPAAPARPKLPPDQGDQHCENAVTTKKLEFASPPFPSLKSRAGALRGPRVHVPEPPWCRESRSCGRAACSRENCALCVAEICTVISSAVRVGRPRVWKSAAPVRLPLQTIPPPSPPLLLAQWHQNWKLIICRKEPRIKMIWYFQLSEHSVQPVLHAKVTFVYIIQFDNLIKGEWFLWFLNSKYKRKIHKFPTTKQWCYCQKE